MSPHGPVWTRARCLAVLVALASSLLQVVAPTPALGAETPVGANEFTLIAIPDTQNMIEGNAAAQARAASETRWIADSKSSLHSVWAAQLGDIVGNNNMTAYGTANAVFATLDSANFPYSVLPGNHDLSIPNPSDDGANFNSTFPPSRFSSRSTNWHSDWSTAQYGGYLAPDQPYASTSDPDRGSRDNWGTFTADGMDFLIINIEYGMPSAAVAWAGRILDAFPDHRAIITTHAWLETNGSRMASYDAAFTNLIAPRCNVFLVLSGHNHSGDNLTSGEAQRTDMHTNSACTTTPVHQVMSDYQDRGIGSGTTDSMGALRYYVFDPDKGLIHALTYYPATDAYETDSSSQFDLAYEMSSTSTYVPLTPTRILDTRNGTGGLAGPFTNHVARTFQVTGGSSGVPAGAAAVTGNLTVTGQNGSGYLFIGPVATNNPTSSTLNFPVGDDRANAVTVALGAGGTLSITFVAPSNGPSAHAVFDVTGYFTSDASGATYHALIPARVLDSRNGTGGLSGPFTNHAARAFQVTGGSSGVPSGATAVTGNLTVTEQTSNGYLYIGPVATNNPTSSTLNFPVGDDRANAVTVALGTGGTLSVTFVAPSNGPTAHAIFDVTGYFTADMTGATFVPLNPTRILDTRTGTGGLSGPFTNHAARSFAVTGAPSHAIAVTGNLTVAGQTSNGYLFIGPAPTNNPTSSTLNFPVADDRANAVTVATSDGGTLSITFVAPSNGPTAYAIFDLAGFYVP